VGPGGPAAWSILAGAWDGPKGGGTVAALVGGSLTEVVIQLASLDDPCNSFRAFFSCPVECLVYHVLANVWRVTVLAEHKNCLLKL